MTKRPKTYTEKQVTKLVEKGKRGRYYVSQNLYLLVKDKGIASWFLRRQFKNKRIEKKIGNYASNNVYFLDYVDAIELATKYQRAFDLGLNPFEQQHALVNTLDELVSCYLDSQSGRYIKEQEIYAREIQPLLGNKLLTEITRNDLESVLKSMVDADRKSIALRAMYFFRTLFNYASTHKLVIENVSAHLKPHLHAANDGELRDVVLSESEIEKVFNIFQQFPEQAPLRNQIAIALYLMFGCRKSELLKAKWSDFDVTRQELTLRPTKRGREELIIVIPDTIMPLLNALKAMSQNSPFLFPSVKGSKSGHLSESTLNNMLKKFFRKHKTRSVSFENPMGAAGVKHFWIHDLRRTFTSHANDLGADSDVTDRCLNHKKRGKKRIYDKSIRKNQRAAVYSQMAELIYPLTNLSQYTEEQCKLNSELKSA
ncbi:tyrosine-type recombinase/integrase [Alteromonas gracilis]|uniref:tyrosine-type recombinase/integrase n=1 Tax=Alteromonas gracilis TaxID=1479524 RepID=UPI0030CD1335